MSSASRLTSSAVDVARDDEDRVVGRIEAPIESERILAIELLDLGFPADHRRSVRVIDEERRRHRLAELGSGHRIDAHAPLLEHHVALRAHHRGRQGEVAHPIGLEGHHGMQMLLRHALEIGRVIIRGEGILLAAELGDEAREFALRMGLRALEHQMLEEMRDPGTAARLIGRADAIPDHVGHDRRAMIRDDDDVEAVRQAELADRHGIAPGAESSRLRGERDPMRVLPAIMPEGSAARERRRHRYREPDERQARSRDKITRQDAAGETGTRKAGASKITDPCRDHSCPSGAQPAPSRRRADWASSSFLTGAPYCFLNAALSEGRR